MELNRDSKKFLRWQLAQRQQKKNQLYKKGNIHPQDIKRFHHYRGQEAASVFNFLSEYKSMSPQVKILEIGSGPHGINFFFPIGVRIAIDPLAFFFNKEFAFYQKGSGSLICQGIGECLPFADKSFDVVISDNVLDHTLDIDKIFTEIHRVMKNDGILYLAIHLHHFVYRLFSFIFRMFHSMNIVMNTPNYKAHTYFFTPAVFKRKIMKGKFTMVHSQIPHSAKQKISQFKPFKNIYSSFICFKYKPNHD